MRNSPKEQELLKAIEVHENTIKACNDHIETFKIELEDVRKKSPFQEWNTAAHDWFLKYTGQIIPETEVKRLRQEGWNAAIEKTLDIIVNSDVKEFVFKIAKLKEK